jgi:hypothetical protein
LISGLESQNRPRPEVKTERLSVKQGGMLPLGGDSEKLLPQVPTSAHLGKGPHAVSQPP